MLDYKLKMSHQYQFLFQIETSNGPRTIRSLREKKPDFFKREIILKEKSFKLSNMKKIRSELKAKYTYFK